MEAWRDGVEEGLAEGEDGLELGTRSVGTVLGRSEGLMEVSVVGDGLGALEGCAVGWAVIVGSAVIVGTGDMVGIPDGNDVGELDAIGVG